MGAVNFSIDLDLILVLQNVLPLDTFVETGTFHGDSVWLIRDHFRAIYSVELSPDLYKEARFRFAEHSHIDLVCEESSKALASWASSMQGQSILYYLDAHWCVEVGAAGTASRCPLLDEIRAIGPLGSECVLIIDDARLFLAPPLGRPDISGWPDFDEVLDCLRRASVTHRIMVLNDIILFYPPIVGGALKSYARQKGVDWLSVMNRVRDYDNIRIQFGVVSAQLTEKDRLIKYLHQECEEHDAMDAWRRHSFYGRVRALHRSLCFPKIGRLRHHDPIPLGHRGMAPAPDYQKLLNWPRISIVTPSYNQAEYIGETIDSVLDQHYPNLEYFVQDGGSTDSTVDILRRYAPNLSGWASETDDGQSQAINLGFSKTSGDVMAWLNSDDLLLPGALAYVAEYFSQHPDIDVVYGYRVLIDRQDREIGRWILPMHDDVALLWADFIPQETLFWRRSIWEKVGGKINEKFRFAMDWDLLLRFQKAGARMVCLPVFLGAFRIHNLQKTSSEMNESGQQEMDRLRLRELGYIPSRRQIRWALLPYIFRHTWADISWRIGDRLRRVRAAE